VLYATLFLSRKQGIKSSFYLHPGNLFPALIARRASRPLKSSSASEQKRRHQYTKSVRKLELLKQVFLQSNV